MLILLCYVDCRDFDYGSIRFLLPIVGRSAFSPASNCFDVIGMDKTLSRGAYWIGPTKEEAVIVVCCNLCLQVDLLQTVEQYRLATVLRNIQFCKDFKS